MSKPTNKRAPKTVATRTIATQPPQPTKTTSRTQQKQKGGRSSKQARVVAMLRSPSRHDHSSGDEGNRLAAALGSRLSRGRGAKEASTQTQIRRRSTAIEFTASSMPAAAVPSLDVRADNQPEHHAARDNSIRHRRIEKSSTSRSRDCAVSMSGTSSQMAYSLSAASAPSPSPPSVISHSGVSASGRPSGRP